MEGLAAAGGVIAVVSLAGQVLEGCSYLKDIFDKAYTAPKEIRLLANELAIIQNIVRSTPNTDEHQDELDFCQERLSKLRNIIDKYGDLDGTKRSRQWGKRLAMALNADKIEKHIVHLREARGYLERIQNLSAHDQTLVKVDQVHESVQLLSTSHSELARITSRSEGRLQEIEGIARQTQTAIHELADRFLHRESGRCIEAEHTVQRLIVSFEAMLREQLSEHRSRRPELGTTLDVPFRLDDSCQRIPSSRSSSRTGRLHPAEHGNQTDMPNGYFDAKDGGYSDNLPFTEKTSTFRSSLGKAIFRTISICYSSATEMADASLPIDMSGWANGSTHFPTIITTTEILLIPHKWSETRFASITCQHIISSTLNTSDINLQINKSAKLPDTKQSSFSTSPISQDVGHVFEAQRKRPKNPSQLLYIAFRTAFYAASVGTRTHKQDLFQRLVVRTPVARNSFDSEINDALEVIQLWINSGFDADVYRQAFPGDVAEKAQIEKECQAIVRSGSKSPREFHRLRLEYTFSIVSEMVAQSCNRERLDLDAIHMVYWDHFQALAIPTLQYSIPGVKILQTGQKQPKPNCMACWMISNRTCVEPGTERSWNDSTCALARVGQWMGISNM